MKALAKPTNENTQIGKPRGVFAGSFNEGQVYDKKYGKQSSLDSWFCAGAEAWIQAGVVEKAQFTDDRGVSYAKTSSPITSDICVRRSIIRSRQILQVSER